MTVAVRIFLKKNNMHNRLIKVTAVVVGVAIHLLFVEQIAAQANEKEIVDAAF